METTKELIWFSKHEHSTTVTCMVQYTVPGLGPVNRDEFVSEPDAMEIATQAGKSTWDEDDLCQVLGATRATPPLEPLQVDS